MQNLTIEEIKALTMHQENIFKFFLIIQDKIE
jgi:hypothetical protein